ncbi:MAG: amino acid permease [Candidatus Ancillula sp.]|nr:amino acid permease [Candidatus Ancillula sp.]
MKIFRKRSVEHVLGDIKMDKERSLKRNLKWFDVAMLGVSVAVGAGIFSIGAKVIVNQTGPAAIISFIIAAAICLIAVMCYAEFSTVIPVAGSSYSFAYVSLGEIFAWIIGWNVILELFMLASVVVKYWSVYLYTGLKLLGINLSNRVTIGSVTFDWAIILGIIIFTIMLIMGTKFSARTAGAFVLLKVCVILFIVIMGFRYFNFSNLTPFIPDYEVIKTGGLEHESLFSFLLGQQPTHFGIMGIFSGAAIIFFAFVGFDSAASVAEETVNPKKNMPLGLLSGILIVSTLYILTTIVTAGMVNRADFEAFQLMHQDETISLATAFEIKGDNGIGAIASFGAFFGLTTVVLISMMGLARMIFAMSRDGLFPRSISRTSKRGTPIYIQIGVGIAVAGVAAFTRVEELEEMTNIGTLCAFILVSFAILVLRKNQGPDYEKSDSFRVPFCPVLPILSGVLSIWLAINLSIGTWLRFLVYFAVGIAFYFLYSRKHSTLAKNPELVANN